MKLKRELFLILVLLLTIVVLVKAVDFFTVNVEQADAAMFVLEDLKYKYPNADIGVLQTVEKYNPDGQKYYEVKARVTQGLNSPCPRREHIYYNYPVQNFVPQPADVITQGCKVCTEGTCILNFPEEAIIASHTFSGTKDVSTYLVQASATPSAEDMGGYWRVKWGSSSASSYYNVDISKNGTILNVTQVSKS